MDLRTKFKVFGVLSRMSNRIMKHQQENGFDTIFDFLNEDIADVKKYVCGGETSHEISGLHLQRVSGSVCTCEYPAKMKGENKCWRCKKPFKEFLQTER